MTRTGTAFCLALSLCAALTASGFGACPSTARAYEEQASLDLSSGYTSVFSSDRLLAHGSPLEVGGSYGLSDMFVLRSGGGYVPRYEHGAIQHTGRLRVEVAYIVDILRWVPFFGVGASAIAYEERSLHVRPSWHVLLGIDFLADRTWVFGLDVRTGVVWAPDGAASVNEAQLRLSRMFELF